MSLAEVLASAINDNIGEVVEEYLSERSFSDEVEAAIEDYDFSDTVKEALRDEINIENDIEKELEHFDFSDSINEAVRDYDWWEEIKGHATDEIASAVEDEVERVLGSDEFKAVVRAVLVQIGKDMLSELWERVSNPFRKLSQWVGAKLSRWKRS